MYAFVLLFLHLVQKENKHQVFLHSALLEVLKLLILDMI